MTSFFNDPPALSARSVSRIAATPAPLSLAPALCGTES
jgi:hypothetical protein